MLKNKKIMAFICGVMMIVMLCSTASFAAENNKAADESNKDKYNSEPQVIVVKGSDNIKAYKKANIIRESNVEVSDNDTLVENVTRGTSIPTAVWDLNNSSRSFPYAMSTYVYSDYAYKPNSNYLAIYHEITPNSGQTIRLGCYKKSNNALYASYSDYIDDETLVGFGGMSITERYYFKYTSVNGNLISGSAVVF